mgnify:CR=1 FL=1
MILRIVFLFSFIFLNYLYAECSDLDSTECLQWAEYCEWNAETSECQEIGGGGGDTVYGPYEVLSISQSDGMRDGPLYSDATLYYPVASDISFTSVILGPGWGGDGDSMAEWAYFFASYGFTATTIDYNDPINESHQQRAEAMLDLIETVKLENIRNNSPVYNKIDTNKFAAVGYSLSGGVTQIIATLDSSLDAAIALNPTIIIEDCDGCSDFEYCICLLPEHLDHSVPTLIVSGEDEINELPSYDGLLGNDQYFNTPESTLKMLYEIEGGSHGSAAYPTNNFVQSKTLNWLKFNLMDSTDVCNPLLEQPDDASLFLTTLDCNISQNFDINSDGEINQEDLTMLVVSIINGNDAEIEGDFNFDQLTDIFDILLFSEYLNENS